MTNHISVIFFLNTNGITVIRVTRRSICKASIGVPRIGIKTLPGSRVDVMRAWRIANIPSFLARGGGESICHLLEAAGVN